MHLVTYFSLPENGTGLLSRGFQALRSVECALPTAGFPAAFSARVAQRLGQLHPQAAVDCCQGEGAGAIGGLDRSFAAGGRLVALAKGGAADMHVCAIRGGASRTDRPPTCAASRRWLRWETRSRWRAVPILI